MSFTLIVGASGSGRTSLARFLATSLCPMTCWTSKPVEVTSEQELDKCVLAAQHVLRDTHEAVREVAQRELVRWLPTVLSKVVCTFFDIPRGHVVQTVIADLGNHTESRLFDIASRVRHWRTNLIVCCSSGGTFRLRRTAHMAFVRQPEEAHRFITAGLHGPAGYWPALKPFHWVRMGRHDWGVVTSNVNAGHVCPNRAGEKDDDDKHDKDDDDD